MFFPKSTSKFSVLSACWAEGVTQMSWAPQGDSPFWGKGLPPRRQVLGTLMVWGQLSRWWNWAGAGTAEYYEQADLSSLFVCIPSDETVGKPSNVSAAWCVSWPQALKCSEVMASSSREHHVPPDRNSSVPVAPRIWRKDFIIHSQPLPKEFPSPFERKAEGRRKEMSAPGTGHFRQREASCKIGKEGLWITIGYGIPGS